jgi:hypothetical protein
MLNANFTIESLSNFLKDSITPDTMEYFYAKLTNLTHRTQVNRHGVFDSKINCSLGRQEHAFYFGSYRINDINRAQVYFVLDLFENKILPKSRTLRIVSKKSSFTLVPNPKAGQFKVVSYGAYTQKYPEPEFIQQQKYHYLYARNSWDRKNELVIKKESEEKDGAPENCQEVS